MKDYIPSSYLLIRREFEMLKMKENESVKECSSKLSHVVNQMSLYGEVVDDNKVVAKMLIMLEQSLKSMKPLL